MCQLQGDHSYSFVYTSPVGRRPGLVHDSRLRKLKQYKAWEQLTLTKEMALMGEPGEAAELGSVCATQVLLGQGIMSVFHESANMILDLVQ